MSSWQNFIAGDRASFEAIYLAYFDGLFLYGLRFTPDHDAVKDEIQNIFTHLWDKRANVGQVHHPKAYLHQALRNGLLNRLRDSKNHPLTSLEDTPYTFELELPVEAAIIQQEQLEETLAQLKSALAQLTEKQKEMLYLKYVKGMSFEEIAQVVGITQKALYKLHARAIASLRENFSDNRYSIAFLLCLYFRS